MSEVCPLLPRWPPLLSACGPMRWCWLGAHWGHSRVLLCHSFLSGGGGVSATSRKSLSSMSAAASNSEADVRPARAQRTAAETRGALLGGPPLAGAAVLGGLSPGRGCALPSPGGGGCSRPCLASAGLGSAPRRPLGYWLWARCLSGDEGWNRGSGIVGFGCWRPRPARGHCTSAATGDRLYQPRNRKTGPQHRGAHSTWAVGAASPGTP